eukprot:jgi/Galph1/2690/GphlegSOOS_G1357.1
MARFAVKKNNSLFHKEKQERQNIIQVVKNIPPRLYLKGKAPCPDEAREGVNIYSATEFQHLPISRRTLHGLQQSGFQSLTLIQRMALPLCLRGDDVLGAARTGSGKTLAFLVPVLEYLWRADWTSLDGLGALIISPTRELAIQIFEVLRKVGKNHSFSAGLVIGGKSFEEEKERIGRMNILIATPGRLLQHMDQSLDFDCSRLQILVLDEADRILDLGFAKTIDAILQNVPKERQTLLFSATQTRSVQSLARLSLSHPEYVAVYDKEMPDGEEPSVEALNEQTENSEKEEMENEAQKSSFVDIPSQLKQSFAITEASEKLNILWSFIKSHTKCKSIIFFASCKQVRFVYEAFRKMKPGLVLLHIHGRMKQSKRLTMYQQFCSQAFACLLATDVASRGLDFPRVDWVVQVDCPDSVESYIHRIGRTARMNYSGNSLLFLLPSETAFLERLKQRQIEPKKHKVNRNKTQDISGTLASLNASDTSLKYLCQRALCCYIRAVAMERDKEVFDVSALPVQDMAEKYGLAIVPKLKLPKMAKPTDQNRNTFGYRRENTSEGVILGIARKKADTEDSVDKQDEEELLHARMNAEENYSQQDWKAAEQNLEERRKRRREKQGKDIEKQQVEKPLSSFGDDTSETPVRTIEEYAKQVSEKLMKTMDEVKETERRRIVELHKKKKRLRRNSGESLSGSDKEFASDDFSGGRSTSEDE